MGRKMETIPWGGWRQPCGEEVEENTKGRMEKTLWGGWR